LATSSSSRMVLRGLESPPDCPASSCVASKGIQRWSSISSFSFHLSSERFVEAARELGTVKLDSGQKNDGGLARSTWPHAEALGATLKPAPHGRVYEPWSILMRPRKKCVLENPAITGFTPSMGIWNSFGMTGKSVRPSIGAMPRQMMWPILNKSFANAPSPA
jgi:hypothetical protein